ncbi:porin [Burkholderia sp. MSMB1078WGS]|uniref:porin n=1 Tax=Burkholderia sp. MSMB1078WGS TaxID=1637900 RepID=UPI00075285AD|nr:porin [Burkholderia sp. MSMB1078WGS]KVT10861.1 porin [Burkholderia sp. MSMB1078WGS]
MTSTNCHRCIVILAGALLWNIGNAAYAQGSVTLYGVMDTGLLYTSKTRNSTTSQSSGQQGSVITGGRGSSLFGLKGVEDLGGGVNAIFALESGISSSNGGIANSNGNVFGREAWVGLTGNFGTFKAGVQYSPFAISLIATDSRNVSYFGSMVPIYIGSVLVTGIFNSNSVSYTSPAIAGFRGSALLALGGEAGNFQAGRQYSFGLNYSHGPFMLSAAMYSGNSGGTPLSAPTSSTVPFNGRTVGASYRFDDLTVKAVLANFKVAGSFNNRVYGGGLSYSITRTATVDTGVWYTIDGNDSRNHSIMAATGLNYGMSKLTSLYGQVGFVHNQGKMNTGLSTNGALHGAQGTTIGIDIGIRHMF